MADDFLAETQTWLDACIKTGTIERLLLVFQYLCMRLAPLPFNDAIALKQNTCRK